MANPEVDLDTHVQDILGVIECEELNDIILVGSSSGSMAMAGVANHIPRRVHKLVYIDTLIPEDGQSWMDLLGPSVAQPLLDAAQRFGDGWRIPRSDVHPPRWVAQPLKSVTQPHKGYNPDAANIPHTYIHCTEKPDGWFFGLGAVIDKEAEKAKERGWAYYEMRTDHLPMLSAPSKLSELLAKIAVTR